MRYSLKNPKNYLENNVDSFLNILEFAKNKKIKHLIYASSSSVYGLNTKQPFSEEDNVNHPISMYAVTKGTNELMAHSYSLLYIYQQLVYVFLLFMAHMEDQTWHCLNSQKAY